MTRPTAFRRFIRLLLRGAAPGLIASGCAESTAPPLERASLSFNVMTPATVRTLVVTVSGPGMDSAVVSNLPVSEAATASGTVTVPAGAARRLEIVAMDTGGVPTHRADTTLRLVPGANEPLALVLRPLASSVGVTVTFGSVTLSLAPSDTEVVAGEVLTLSATATSTFGTVPSDELVWGTTDPSVATVNAGLVRGVRAGIATIVVSHRGAALRRRITVPPGLSPALTGHLILVEGPDRPTNQWVRHEIRGRAAQPTLGVRIALFGGASYVNLTPDLLTAIYSGNDAAESIRRRTAPGFDDEVVLRGGRNFGVRLSRNGQRLVWMEENGCFIPCREIWTANADASAPLRLTQDDLADSHPSISADGQTVLWSRGIADVHSSIWRMTSTGAERLQLTQGGLHALPSMSPDGTHIVYSSYESGVYALYVMHADGSGAVELAGTRGLFDVGTAGLGAHPVWAPNSRSIAFNGTPAGGSPGVYVMPIDNRSAPVRLNPLNTTVNVYGWVDP